MNMHADEKSDGVTVPEKRPNKEGLPSAEVVEGRTPLKGNGGQTAAVRTHRAQDDQEAHASDTPGDQDGTAQTMA